MKFRVGDIVRIRDSFYYQNISIKALDFIGDLEVIPMDDCPASPGEEASEEHFEIMYIRVMNKHGETNVYVAEDLKLVRKIETFNVFW